MKILMIGGTGVISTEVSKRLIETGVDLTLMNRGTQSRGICPDGAEVILCDVRDGEKTGSALRGRRFDAIVDWISFTPDQLEQNLRVMRGIYDQYVFISSAAVYKRGMRNVTEDAPRTNLAWNYARDKVACEELLKMEDDLRGCCWTVVRPSVTYGDTRIPFAIIPNRQWTVADRMLKGKPIVMHDDGSARTSVTHSSDFAKGICGLLGNPKAFRQAFHIMSDEVFSWKELAFMEADALGVKPNLVYIPSLVLCREMPMTQQGNTYGVLMCNKANTNTYDNSKIKNAVPEFVCTTPFAEGIRRTMAFYRKHPAYQLIDEEWNREIDRLCDQYA